MQQTDLIMLVVRVRPNHGVGARNGNEQVMSEYGHSVRMITCLPDGTHIVEHPDGRLERTQG
jgi:hypothetical protein